ncbi:MAG: histidine--tRNA ligase [Patescibacteria group bacterium]|mgnify:CR=1 FL=1
MAKQQKKVKAKLFQNIRGMADILPKEQDWWRSVLRTGETVAELHDFYFIETPILEELGLFESGVGQDTDVVDKQMYSFKTKGGENVAMRPEGTAPVMRSYLQHHLGYFSSPLKVYYCGPMFRQERPQQARYRQFHQWGFEILGDSDSVYDVQIMLATLDFLKSLKLKDLTLKINTIGCRVCRPNYRNKLKEYYRYKKKNLCVDCDKRYEKNVLRLLDCREPECEKLKKEAPIVLDHLCAACNNQFRTILELIEDNDISYTPDPYLVRGLDYYNRTVFEIFTPSLPNLAIASGGRYDYLSESIGGRMVPSVGVAIGIERVIEAMKAAQIPPKIKRKERVFFAAIGDQAKKASVKIINMLRSNGIPVSETLGKKSLRAQMKSADKIKAPITLIFGQKEVFEGAVIVRDMKSGAQENVITSKLVEEVKKRLK